MKPHTDRRVEKKNCYADLSLFEMFFFFALLPLGTRLFSELNSEMMSIFIWYFGRCADIAVKRDNPVNPGAHLK